MDGYGAIAPPYAKAGPSRTLALQCPLSVTPQNYESVPHLLRSEVNAVLREIGALQPSATSAQLDETPIRIKLNQDDGYLQIEARGCVQPLLADTFDRIRRASAHCTTDPYIDTDASGRMTLVCRVNFDVVSSESSTRALEAAAPHCSIQTYTHQNAATFERLATQQPDGTTPL